MYLLLEPAIGGTDAAPSRAERSRRRHAQAAAGTGVDQPRNLAKSVTVE